MKLALMGPICIRVPTGGEGLPSLCKRNPDGSNFVVKGHKHKRPHVTAFWGRWKVTIEAEIKNPAGEVIGLQHIETKFISGAGPDSLVLIKADLIHTLELLDETGFYACNFGHYKDDEPVGEYQGDHTDYE